MVEGLDVRSLMAIERREHMVIPGSILFLIGLFMPIIIEKTGELYGSFSIYDGGAFDLAFCCIMFLGLFLSALGIIFRERGAIHKQLAASLMVVLIVDVILWFCLPILGLSSPTGLISLLPFLAPAQIPLGLTLIFILLVFASSQYYKKDPRKSGKPKYHN